jgi:hypothetical protein
VHRHAEPERIFAAADEDGVERHWKGIPGIIKDSAKERRGKPLPFPVARRPRGEGTAHPTGARLKKITHPLRPVVLHAAGRCEAIY